MKIVHLITTLSYGGAEKQLLELCKGLKNHGHDVVVGVFKPGGLLKEEFKANEIMVCEFEMRNPWDLFVFFRVRRWLKEQSPALVHTHLFKADVFGGFAAYTLNLPLVCTKWNEDQYLKNPFVSWLARQTANRCNRIVAVANAVRSFLIHTAHVDANKIEVIPVGISFRPLPTKVCSQDRVRFGTVARLVEQKGHSYLLEALRNMKESGNPVELFLIGAGPRERVLREIVEENGLHGLVHFCGVVPRVEAIYSEFDILVLPSLWEGAPVVLIEAMLFGIPVIATTVGGVKEIITDDCGILVPPADPAALTNAMIRLASDETLRKKMSEACKEKVRHFDFDHTLRAHLKLYDEVIRSRVVAATIPQ